MGDPLGRLQIAFLGVKKAKLATLSQCTMVSLGLGSSVYNV